MKPAIRAIFSALASIFWRLYAFVEAPLFLLSHRQIFRNPLVYPVLSWSFGHTIACLDFAARLYYPHRISVVTAAFKGTNFMLPLCFEENMDSFALGPAAGGSGIATNARFSALSFWLHLARGLGLAPALIERTTVYPTVGLGGDRFLRGDEPTARLLKYDDWTGYIRLLRLGIGRAPDLPAVVLNACKSAITARHPRFFDRPFVTVLLRRKGEGSAFDSAYRCSGPNENYTLAVRYLTENGYHVVGTGETDSVAFQDIPGYCDLSSCGIEPAVLNLFLLLRAALFIGQQSGPHILPNSRGIPCVIADAVPYRIGTFGPHDLILFKRFREKNTGVLLSVPTVFRHHKDLAFGYNFRAKDVEAEPNTPEEILEAVTEAAARLRNDFSMTPDDERLVAAFRRLPSPEMAIRFHDSRPPLVALRRMRDELLDEASPEGKR